MIIFMRGLEPTVIAVEVEPLPMHLLWHLVHSLSHRHRPLLLDRLPQLLRALHTLHLTGRASQRAHLRRLLFLLVLASRLEHLQRLVPQVLFIPALEIVYTDQQRVIHNLQPLKEGHVALHLRHEHLLLRRSKFEMQIPAQPVQILECGPWILIQVLFPEITSYRAALQIERPMNIAVRREEVVHDDKMHLLAIRQLHPMQSVELRQQRIRVLAHMLVIILQNLA